VEGVKNLRRAQKHEDMGCPPSVRLKKKQEPGKLSKTEEQSPWEVSPKDWVNNQCTPVGEKLKTWKPECDAKGEDRLGAKKKNNFLAPGGVGRPRRGPKTMGQVWGGKKQGI